jgi:hypothetical protein
MPPRHGGQHAAFIEEHQALGSNPAHARRISSPDRASGGHVLTILLGRPERARLSRPSHAPQRPADRPRVNPHTRLLGQAVPVLRQGQMIVFLQQAQQRRLNLLGDARW